MPAIASSDPAAALAQPLAQPLALAGVAVDFGAPGRIVRALQIAALTIAAGERIALVGPSGSGKTSLIHVLAGIVQPAAGTVRWGDIDLPALSEMARGRWRRRTVGLVFQDFHLVPELSLLDNILLPLTFDGRVTREARRKAGDVAARLGLPDPRRRAAALSRGEQQRTAIARALVRSPALLLADEPTASLDPANGAAVGDLLVAEAAARGATLVVATHDRSLIDRLHRSCRIEAGRIGDGERP